MKKSLSAIFFATSAFALAAATVENVRFRQNWPWSTAIKISYDLRAVSGPVDVGVEAFDGEKSLPILTRNALSGDLFGVRSSGPHTIWLDPVRAFGATRTAYSGFKVRLTATASADDIDETLYKIIEIGTGVCTDVTRAELLNGKYGDCETDYGKIDPAFATDETDVLIWTGVTNVPAYRTTHLVMRKIPAANKVWKTGDPSGTLAGNASLQPECHVKLTYDYYMAVFETTEAQHSRMGSTSSASVSALPVNGIGIHSCYGHPKNKGNSLTLVGKEHPLYPKNTYLRDIGGDVPAAKMWARTANAGHVYELNVPTRAEWEFAARGGNSCVLYSGEAQTEVNVGKLAWHAANSGNERHEVGTRLPNAYGLYDMLGGVIERVCSVGSFASGAAEAGTAEDPYVDPTCRKDRTDDSNPSNMGGGSYEAQNGEWEDCRPAPAAGWNEWYSTASTVGYRLVMPARADGQWADHP